MLILMVIFCFFEGSAALAEAGLLIVQFGTEVTDETEAGLLRGMGLGLATELLGASFSDPVPFRWVEFCNCFEKKITRSGN